jgi:tetratricopeptide (TPR) repeat protein
MADLPRIETLRRRVESDPASFAFAPLAEEYRKAGLLKDAIEICRVGLARHPAYVSARATLGRALLEAGDVEAARGELEKVLKTAPENLTALKGLAAIHLRSGEVPQAVARLRLALSLSPADRDLHDWLATATNAPAGAPSLVQGALRVDPDQSRPGTAAPPDVPARPDRAADGLGARSAGERRAAAAGDLGEHAIGDESAGGAAAGFPAEDPSLVGLHRFLAQIERARALVSSHSASSVLR